MSSKRRHEGYVLIDNRAGPGVPDSVLAKHDLPIGVGRGLFESATFTCSHCQSVVVIRPDRSRERAYCRRCDHYICDGCGATMAITKVCKTFNQIADELLNAGGKGKVASVADLATTDQRIIIS